MWIFEWARTLSILLHLPSRKASSIYTIHCWLIKICYLLSSLIFLTFFHPFCSKLRTLILLTWIFLSLPCCCPKEYSNCFKFSIRLKNQISIWYFLRILIALNSEFISLKLWKNKSVRNFRTKNCIKYTINEKKCLRPHKINI